MRPSCCTGYTEYAKLSPYFYKTPDESQELIHYGKLNIGEKLEDIWEVTSSNYTYDYKLINDKPSLFELLPEAENVDISRLQEKLSALSKNKIILSKSGGWQAIAVTVATCICIGLIIIAGIVVHKLRIKSNQKCNFDKVDVNEECEMIDVNTDCEVPSGSNKSPVQLKPALPDALRTRKIVQ